MACASSTEREDKGTVIGIDLGTTFTCVGVYNHGRVEIIENRQTGRKTTPSCIAINKNKELLIGDAAKKYLLRDPTSTAYNIKRFIGREWHDKTIQNNKDQYPFQVVEEKNRPCIKLSNEEKPFKPEEISAMLLRRMKENAEDYLSETVTKAVITVPAYFNDAQRQATKDAGTIAGLDVLRIINEPEAAAIVYSLDKMVARKKVLIFDLGGGTHDVSLMELTKNSICVLATSGNTHLGGEDFDQNMVQQLLTNTLATHCSIDAMNNAKLLQQLRKDAETVKCELSLMEDTTMQIEIAGLEATRPYSRTVFEDLNTELFQASIKPIDVVLEDTHTERIEIDEILLLGGSSRIPRIEELVTDYFRKHVCRKINTSDIVVRGAAIFAAITRGTLAPINVYSVNPYPLGLLKGGNVISEILPRNKPLPTRVPTPFEGFKRFRDIPEIVLYEGEFHRAEENYKLGYLPFSPKQRREGLEEFDVNVNFGQDGLLVVNAVKRIALQKTNGLPSTDIGYISHRLEMYAKANFKQQQIAKLRNRIETSCYLLRSALGIMEEKGCNSGCQRVMTIRDALRKCKHLLDESFPANLNDYTSLQNQLDDITNTYGLMELISKHSKSIKQ